MADFTIAGLEGQAQGVTVTAQFNPKELSVDRAVNWRRQPKHGPSDLEYLGSEPRSLSFELLFDGLDTATSVQPDMAKLQQLSDVDPGLKRPPRVRLSYGATSGTLPPYEAVLEALAVRYLMFDPSGRPMRAIATLKLKEAANVTVGKPS